MPDSDEREPADVSIHDDADIIVKCRSNGHGQNARFHRPDDFYGDKPACAVQERYPDATWQRKRRGVIADQRTPCAACYTQSDGVGQSKEKDCPLCGETVTSTAYHLRNDCEENQ